MTMSFDRSAFQPVGTAASHRFCVAPMMDWTDRHCRFLHRLLSKRARLYTEMLTTGAIAHGDRKRLLGFDGQEHPVALQLGGCDPQALRDAAMIGADWGYDEINLNVGCPSDRVQAGQFGAALMADPGRVAACVAAMRAAVEIPVTVKCRIGIDDQNAEDALPRFADAVINAGCTLLIVHARKAWLDGLSPKENRDVPPLDYPLVHRLKARLGVYPVVINGGIATLEEAQAHLVHVDGVMFGRAAYQNPGLLASVDADLFGDMAGPRDIDTVIHLYAEYCEKLRRDEGVPVKVPGRHLMGFFQGLPGARSWRRALSQTLHKDGATGRVITDALSVFHQRAADESFALA